MILQLVYLGIWFDTYPKFNWRIWYRDEMSGRPADHFMPLSWYLWTAGVYQVSIQQSNGNPASLMAFAIAEQENSSRK